MKKLALGVLLLFFVGTAVSTTVTSEEVHVDIEESLVEADLQVEELTSSQFTYLTSYPISDLNVEINGQEVLCEREDLQLGTEIKCDVADRNSFSAHLEFKSSSLVSSIRDSKVFRFSQSFYRPTNNYSLRVVLPRGTGLVENGNISVPVVSPEAHRIGSNGQRIFVEWRAQPQLGESLDFQVVYRNFSRSIGILEIMIIGLTGVLLFVLGYLGFRYITRKSIVEEYEELSDEEIEVLELLRENGGEMLQKDVVNDLDYSKAKISGIVSGLVEEEYIEKSKEGRSNKLTIARGYRS